MAYTRRTSAEGSLKMPGADPGVISIHIENSASETNIPVKVPWEGCRLAYVYSLVHTAIDGDGDMVIDIELEAGTDADIMSMTVASSSTVGTVDEATFDTESYGRHLTDGTILNIEVDGSTTGTGAINMFLYFEPDTV